MLGDLAAKYYPREERLVPGVEALRNSVGNELKAKLKASLRVCVQITARNRGNRLALAISTYRSSFAPARDTSEGGEPRPRP